MKKSLVFTKSIAFEKTLIDKLEGHLEHIEKEGKKVNFSAEVANLIEAGLKYRQIEKDLLSGKRSRIGEDVAVTTGRAKLSDLVKEKIEFEESALDQPKPVKGLRINKI
jgi:hypothetical protein